MKIVITGDIAESKNTDIKWELETIAEAMATLRGVGRFEGEVIILKATTIKL